MNGDLISRKEAITAIQKAYADTVGGMDKCAVWKNVGLTNALHIMQDLPSVQPERMTNRQWVDFLAAQFDISRTSAKEMLHGMMRWKKEDNFKKMFNGGRHESRPNQQTRRDRSAVAVSVRKSGELHFNY